MTQQKNVPNVYHLAGDGIQITYTVSNANGESQLDYRGAQGNQTFSGNQINFEKSSLGILVTVFLFRSIDAGSITLTLVVPDVYLGNITELPIRNFAVVSDNRFSIIGIHQPRQTQTYQIFVLEGMAGVTDATDNGLVTLKVDATLYSPGDPVVVTLSNQGQESVFFPDHLTNCTVIEVQRQINGNWTEVNPCLLRIATREHHLNAGQHLNVELKTVTDMVGRYRATLTYSVGESGGPSVTIHSPEFLVA